MQIKKHFKRFKKAGIIISSIIIAIVVIAFFIASPLTKYAIQKYDVKYLGREVELEDVYINIFTGYFSFDNLKIYEAKSDSVFFSAEEVYTNIEMLKLLNKTVEFSELRIVKPVAFVIQNKKELNLLDIIDRFSSKDKLNEKKNTNSFVVNLLNIQILDGKVYYTEKSIPVAYSLKEVNINSDGIRSESDTIKSKFSWLAGEGTGKMNGGLIMNTQSLDYSLSLLVSKFNLSILEQYLKEISNNGSLYGNLDANIKATGNFKNAQDIDAKGLLTFNDFHLGETKAEDYVAFKKFTISAKQLSPKLKEYLFDFLALNELYVKYERYDYLDNLQNMFGKEGAKVIAANTQDVNPNFLFLIADYVKALAKNFFQSNYKLNKLIIDKSYLNYIDYTLNEKFEISATSLYIYADSIERSDKWVNLSIRSDIKPYGKVALDLSINPKDSSDFTINYDFKQFSAAMFNPYLIQYTSFPLNRGTIEVKGNWNVRNGIIKSNNHLVFIDPRISSRLKKRGSSYIPLKLIMFFVREKGNVIDYEIPITGDLNNPKFKIKDVIVDALTNLVVKPTSFSYRNEVRNTENDIENSFYINWETQKSELQKSQKKFLKELAQYIKLNPDKKIYITPAPYLEKEKEYILFFEGKKRYYLSKNKLKINQLTYKDSIVINKISIRDSLFAEYLINQVGTDGFYTIQDKCTKLVGANNINSLFEKLSQDRKNAFMANFKEEKLENNFVFKNEINEIPYNGFSMFKISYDGDWPEKLTNAYNRIIELNNKKPRKKFKKEREKANSTIN